MREQEEFIRKFNEAFAKNDQDFILDSMSDDIVWNFVGEKIMTGKDAVKEFMEPMKNMETLELEILQIISRGREAAANGRMKIKEPAGNTKRFGFADFYEFPGEKAAKISRMTSYVVAFKEEQK